MKQPIFLATIRQNNPNFSGDRFAGIVQAVNNLQPLADAHDATMAQLILAWYIKNPAISVVIPGARQPEQVLTMLKQWILPFQITTIIQLIMPLNHFQIKNSIQKKITFIGGYLFLFVYCHYIHKMLSLISKRSYKTRTLAKLMFVFRIYHNLLKESFIND